MTRLPEQMTLQALIDATCVSCGGGQAYIEADVPLQSLTDEGEVVVRIPKHMVAFRVICSSCKRTVNFAQTLEAREADDATTT